MRCQEARSKIYAYAALVGAILLFPSLSNAANHFVRSGAIGTLSGADWTNACIDFVGNCAPGSLVRGDTYYVANGTYCLGATDCTFSAAESGTLIITIKGATASDHGTPTGWQNSFGVDVSPANWSAASHSLRWSTGYWVWDGIVGSGIGTGANAYGFLMRQNLTTSGAIYIGFLPAANGLNNITLNHFEIDGVLCCDVDGTTNSGNTGISYSGGSTQPITNLIVKNAYIHNIKNTQFQVVGANNFIVDHVIQGINRSTFAQHAQAMSVYSINGMTISNSVFYDITGTSVITQISSGHSQNWNIYGNLFYWDNTSPQRSAAQGGCPGVPSVTDCTIGVSAIIEETLSGPLGVDNVLFFNNTVFDVPGSSHMDDCGVFNPSSAGTNSGYQAYNNLWWGCQSFISFPPRFFAPGSHDFNTALQNSAVMDSPGPHDFLQASSTNPFVASLSFPYDLHLTSDTIDLHLNDGNNTNSLVSGNSTDPDGRTRGSPTWTRGAYEFAPTPRPNPPANLRATAVR